MADYTLETLVVRGVSVRWDGPTTGLSLGASAASQTPRVRIFVRHPSRGTPRANANSQTERCETDAKRVAVRAAIGAGRSRGRAGVPAPRRSTGRAVRNAVWRISGSPGQGPSLDRRMTEAMRTPFTASTAVSTIAEPKAMRGREGRA